LKNAGHLEANRMETSLFISNAEGKFDLNSLPIQTQYAPINTITVLDYNEDGNKDALLCGNNSHTKLRLGKMDANYGILLQGDGQGGFQYIDQTESGFQLRGDVKRVVKLDNVLLFGINQSAIEAYQFNE